MKFIDLEVGTLFRLTYGKVPCRKVSASMYVYECYYTPEKAMFKLWIPPNTEVHTDISD